jgi:hypothetical protein
MKPTLPFLLILTLLLPTAATATEKCTVSCVISGFAAKNHRTLAAHKTPTDKSCKIGTATNGFPMPDPTCTPGAVNPTVTVDVLKNPNFRTCCIRDKVESGDAKKVAYGWYSLIEPKPNTDNAQTCELDHLVPLELGGGDSHGQHLASVRPRQCDPQRTLLQTKRSGRNVSRRPGKSRRNGPIHRAACHRKGLHPVPCRGKAILRQPLVPRITVLIHSLNAVS